MEAIHAGVPMILSDSLPQERRTEVYLRAHGAAEGAADPLEVAAIAARLLNSPQELDKLRRAGAGLRRPHAAMDAAKLVLQTAASSRVECGVR
jgi:UDP-N-acetylglucosamine:LPS N-acetylglucosamine transferase